MSRACEARPIERAFADIERSLARLAARMLVAEREAARKATVTTAQVRPRRPATTTRKRRAQLKLQGSYMGYMQQLKPAQKKQVKALKEKRGFEAAIRVATKYANG